MATEKVVLSEAFSKLQSVCVTVAQVQSLENLLKLKEILSSIDEIVLSDLHEYILFPLRLTLKKYGTRSDNTCLCCLECLNRVLSSCRQSIDQPGLYQDLFNTLCCLISLPASGSITVAPVCEELKLETIRCLTALGSAASVKVIRQSLLPAFMPSLGHAVTLLLELARHEPARALRVAALRCLLTVAHVDCQDLVLEAGDVFAAFLPGIVSALAAIITGDAKQGHLVTSTAILCWHRIVWLVLADANLEKLSATDSTKLGHQESSPAERSDYHNLLVKRTDDWVKSTADKLKLVTERIVKAANDSHWKVRLAMVKLAEELIVKCSVSLNCCMLPLLDVLVHATTDDKSAEVSSCSQQALLSFSEHRMSTSARPLIDALEENIFNLACQIPNKMLIPDDGKKLAAIRLLRGYIQLLGPHINSLLQSAVHLQRLSSGLLHVLQFDCSIIHIIEERTPGQTAALLYISEEVERPRNYFKCFASHDIEAELVLICRLLGYYGNLEILLDHFLELFSQSSIYRKQAAYCVNEIITGVHCQPDIMNIVHTPVHSNVELESIVRSVVEEYLQTDYLDLPVTGVAKNVAPKIAAGHVPALPATMKTANMQSVEQLNSNIILICLLLEGIAQCAKVLTTRFQVFLIDVLYPLLVKVGSENARVSCCALLSLRDIAVACGCKNVAELLHANADYIVNSVSLKLRHIARHPEAPLVLRAALLHGNADMLPLVHDVVLEILSTLDQHHSDHAQLFMSVLHALVVSVAAWDTASVSQSASSTSASSDIWSPMISVRPSPSATEIRNFFREYRVQKSVVYECASEDVNTEDINGDDNQTDVDSGMEVESDTDKKEPPDHIKLVIQIMSRCQHLLMSSDARQRLLVLDTVTEACLAMRSHRDELLPLAHCLWKPFVQRFTDAEPVVTIKAFHVLKVMAETCGDFIRRRFTDDVLPKICSSLDKLALNSVKVGPSYQFTQVCRLQLCILSNLGPLCKYADVDGSHLFQLMISCVPYLSCQQPTCLQQACVETFKYFIGIDPDSVWLLLNDVYCPQSSLTPPCDCLPVIQMSGSSEQNEYTDNVSVLLNLL